jgi:hypothetical protein
MMLILTWSLSCMAWHAGPGDSSVHQVGQGQGPRVPAQVSWLVKYYCIILKVTVLLTTISGIYTNIFLMILKVMRAVTTSSRSTLEMTALTRTHSWY